LSHTIKPGVQPVARQIVWRINGTNLSCAEVCDVRSLVELDAAELQVAVRRLAGESVWS